MQEYVVGFPFDIYGRVPLIRKNRPEWQRGRFNGVGGHVEAGEDPETAMEREFAEETGVQLHGWRLFVIMEFPGARIYFFTMLDVPSVMLESVRTMTDEEVFLFDHARIPWTGTSGIIPNLSWLIPLATYRADEYEPIHVTASVSEALG